MTLKMIIVDDEPIVSQGLAQTIPWEEFGVEIIGIAYNGKQGLELLEQETVDLVLTDISMPEMDGLEMAEHVFHDYPNTKIIMFSGYDEFEYARKAVRLGVEDYLLKPVDLDELIGLVQKVKQSLVRTRQTSARRHKEMLAQAVLHQLFDAPQASELQEEMQKFRRPYRLVLSELNDYAIWAQTHTDLDMQQFKTEWKQRLDQIFSEGGFETVSMFGRDNLLISVCYRDQDEQSVGADGGEENLRKMCESLTESVTSSWRICISAVEDQLAHLSALYHNTERALAHCRGKKQMVTFVERVPSELDVPEAKVPPSVVKQLRKLLLNGEKKQAEAQIEALFRHFQETGIPLANALASCRELFATLHNELKTVAGKRMKQAVRLQLHEPIDLNVYNTYNALRQILDTDVNLLCDALEDPDRHHWVLENVKKDIHEQYREEIRASELADKHFISPNYLSVLFKQDTGQSFSEYVNELRIRKACELLETTSLKVFVIAEEVGYKEYKYFAQVFKKHVGMTPTRYRRLKSMPSR